MIELKTVNVDNDLEVNEIVAKIKKITKNGLYNEHTIGMCLNIIDNSNIDDPFLLHQRAKLLRKLGELRENIDIIKSSIDIYKGLDMDVLVYRDNYLKCIFSLCLANYDKEVFAEAVKIINKYSFEGLDKNTIKKYKEIEEKYYLKENKNISDSEKEELSDLYTKLYYNYLTIEEVNNSSLNEWDKDILLLAIYEKNNKKNGLIYLKNLIKKYNNNVLYLKQLNMLRSNFESTKITYFNVYTYGKILEANLNLDKKFEKPEEKIEIKETRHVKEIVPQVKQPKQVKPISNYVSSTGKSLNRYSNSNNVINTNENKNINKEILIKDMYKDECNAIAMYIYSRTYSGIRDIVTKKEEINFKGKTITIYKSDFNNYNNWIKSFDNFMCLIDNPVSNKEKLEKFLKILTILKEKRALDINVSNDRLDSNKILTKTQK